MTNHAIQRQVGIWFLVWTALLLITVIIGGVTRLTESGLSITEWQPVAGVLPPLSDASWQTEFEKYQKIPQYREINTSMTLAEFKRIYWVEWIHRFWARLVGIAIALPALLILIRQRTLLDRSTKRRLVMLLALMGVQGAMGWYMVSSGLSDRVSVSQYRLAAHLTIALLLIGLAIWSAADLLASASIQSIQQRPSIRRLQRGAAALVILVTLTAIAGAFVAGLDAGRAYNTFPLMGGRWIPVGYAALNPWWRNLFDHIPAVQFNHRLLGIATAVTGLSLMAVTFRGDWPEIVRSWGRAVGIIAVVQAMFGIMTLVLAVPLFLAVVHQAMAVILLMSALMLWHSVRRIEG